ncbi:PQQ-binding-like beta-propeller repeat protein [Halolamina sp. CBA1230]|uniref:outer membrane protein assembly factor BamB family protein n=1 Tax=Halolamina sp. CBA1230 TaxID=1853690 RepID=UPI001301E913|nr:PQQ-binding-like beta-propeller repeat protein [Halolamina sp. CBA1230]QKY20998.1 PQQ-binding-like beta-propeller repeat protein [Halolamina sp. CBA1230]
MRRRAFLATAVGAAAALAGCSSGTGRELPSTPDGDWTHHAHDARNSGAATVGVPPRGTPAWDRGAAGSATPLVDGDAVYSVADSATALEARTGEELWATELPATADRTPVLTDDLLVVAADDRLLALDRADGEERWNVGLPRPADAALTVDPASETITVPLAGRRGAAGLVAYDTAGERLWADDTLAARATAIDGDAVSVTGYLQDGNTGVLRRLSVTDGGRQWERELDGPDTAPVVADAGVLVGDGGTLALHDPADGERVRTLGTFGDRIPETPAVADGTAFVTSSEGDLVAVEIDEGTERWRRAVGVVAGTGVGVGRDAVVASVTDLPEGDLAGIAAYERDDGAPRWEHEIEGFDASPSTAPVLAEGAVFYASNESDGVVALGDLPPATGAD